jgi:hypothetical protein
VKDLYTRTRTYLNGAVLNPRNFPLQIVKRVSASFDGEEWLFEIKHDGFRVIAVRDGGPARLFTRNGYDINRRHQHIIAALSTLPAERFVLDGELVVLDEDGRSNFAKLAHGRTGTHYYGFDLLVFGPTCEQDHLKPAKPYWPIRYTVAAMLFVTAITLSEKVRRSSTLYARPDLREWSLSGESQSTPAH